MIVDCFYNNNNGNIATTAITIGTNNGTYIATTVKNPDTHIITCVLGPYKRQT